ARHGASHARAGTFDRADGRKRRDRAYRGLKLTAAPPKERVRERVWTLFEETGEVLFPGARGRIPNFRGAALAADRLASTPEWRAARVIKCNPDAPQRPVRHRALREGKLLYMAVPRLAEKKCFWRLDPSRISKRDLARAATI